MEREKKIIKTSIYGIIVNLILVGFKATVGLIVNSIAIVLDAVNNLSDAISAVVTIVGTKLSSKKPDKEHPYGHGRIEYFAATIIAVIVLLAGVTSLKESFVKIIEPEAADYSVASLIIISVAVIVKLVFGKYVKKIGKEIKSQSLIATGTDAFMDAVLSFSTLVAAIISLIWHISLEGYLGVIISLIIIKSSYEILKDTINDMIGIRADSELTTKIKQTVLKIEEVQGIYDLILHNYGPSKIIGSAHIQIRDDMTAKEIDKLSRKIQSIIFKEYGIILTIGIYAANDAEKYKNIKEDLIKIVADNKSILQMHGFYVDEETKNISFDLIFDFECKDSIEIKENIEKVLKQKYPQYDYNVLIDTDFSD